MNVQLGTKRLLRPRALISALAFAVLLVVPWQPALAGCDEQRSNFPELLDAYLTLDCAASPKPAYRRACKNLGAVLDEFLQRLGSGSETAGPTCVHASNKNGVVTDLKPNEVPAIYPAAYRNVIERLDRSLRLRRQREYEAVSEFEGWISSLYGARAMRAPSKISIEEKKKSKSWK